MVENCIAGYNSCMFAYGQVRKTFGLPMKVFSFSQAEFKCLIWMYRKFTSDVLPVEVSVFTSFLMETNQCELNVELLADR